MKRCAGSDRSASFRYELFPSKRGVSQLQLSANGSVSQRHLNFLESGRAQSSKELILKLGIALDIPRRQRNVMLLSAGCAPAYPERKLGDPELAAVSSGLDFILRQQSPYPTLVVDRLWNLHMSNASAAGMIKWLLGVPDSQEAPGNGAVNVIKVMLDPGGVRQYVENWQETAADLLYWIQRETMSDGPGSEASTLLRELAAMCAMEDGMPLRNLERPALPFLPLSIRKDGVEPNLFTAIATLGTPCDVTLHELRIETFLPADDATGDWFRERFGVRGGG